MRRTWLTWVVCLLVLGLVSGMVTAAPVKLRFLSLAWQEQSIAANKDIVAEWNRQHPDIQVEYVQGDWGSIHDYLLTGFETGEVPDVFHYESVAITDFAARGYLTNLAPMIDDEMKQDIFDGAWQSVRRSDGGIYGIPFLWESMIVLYNADLLAKENIELPTVEDPWTWDELRAVARKLTKDKDGDGRTDQWGAAFGLKSPANRILNLTLGFGGGYFVEENGKYKVKVGDAEKKLLNTIMAMIFEDKSTDPDSVGQSGSSLLPGFFAGKYAMLPGIGVWARQQIVENGPKDFRWGVLPPIKGETQAQGSGTQTLSVPKASKHQKEAMEFIKFFLTTKNMARLALGDWLFPTRKSSLQLPEFQTETYGWKTAVASVEHLTMGPWQDIPGYAEWKSRVANPTLQELFAGRLTVEEAAKRIEDEGNRVLRRYQ